MRRRCHIRCNTLVSDLQSVGISFCNLSFAGGLLSSTINDDDSSASRALTVSGLLRRDRGLVARWLESESETLALLLEESGS